MEKKQRGRVLSANCPSRQILQHLTNRWGGLVLVSLIGGAKRFSDLRREVEGISERMLTQTLQQLEQDGILTRKSFNTVPPHVEYRLTEFGEQAASRMLVLINWLEDNLEAILAAQPKRKNRTD